MAEIWKGKAVADALNEKMIANVTALKEKGVTPTLAILRVGERPDDISYEKGAIKRCDQVGVAALGCWSKITAMAMSTPSARRFSTSSPSSPPRAFSSMTWPAGLTSHGSSWVH